MFLDYNMIKHVNSDAFQGLGALRRVSLDSNECVDEDYTNQTGLTKMAEELSEKCGFIELVRLIL